MQVPVAKLAGVFVFGVQVVVAKEYSGRTAGPVFHDSDCTLSVWCLASGALVLQGQLAHGSHWSANQGHLQQAVSESLRWDLEPCYESPNSPGEEDALTKQVAAGLLT